LLVAFGQIAAWLALLLMASFHGRPADRWPCVAAPALRELRGVLARGGTRSAARHRRHHRVGHGPLLHNRVNRHVPDVLRVLASERVQALLIGGDGHASTKSPCQA
jgi:hypothetical protein